MKRAAATVLLTLSFSAVGQSAFAADAATTQYLTKVNAICKAGIAKMNGVAAPNGPADVKGYLAKELVLSKSLVTQIQAVKAPAGLQANVTKALAAEQKVNTIITGLIAKLDKGGDPETVINEAGPTMDKATKASDPFWKAAGLTSCVA